MDAEKYNRTISLQCPTCGSTQFKYSEKSEVIKCASCEREISKDELTHENDENIQEHADEIGKQVVQDFSEQLKKSLQDAFKNSKFIKVK